MRALLFLSSFVLALPGIALACVFLVLGNALATHSFFGFLGALAHTFVALLPWGLLAILAAILTLLIGGIGDRYRWLASACVALLAIASSIIVFAITCSHGNFTPDQLPFHIPAALSATLGIWLAQREWPARPAGKNRG